MLPRRSSTVRNGALCACSAALFLTACSSGSSGGGTTVAAHQDIVLRDHLGAPLTPASTAPYSPRETCGACHGIDQIANGYHFQQGRTDASGAIIVQDNYFGDGANYVRSPGMYGKW